MSNKKVESKVGVVVPANGGQQERTITFSNKTITEVFVLKRTENGNTTVHWVYANEKEAIDAKFTLAKAFKQAYFEIERANFKG